MQRKNSKSVVAPSRLLLSSFCHALLFAPTSCYQGYLAFQPSSEFVSLPRYTVHPFAQHGGEKNLLKCAWSPDGEMVSAGSSDQAVHIWDEPSTQELYFLPGHTGSVNEVSKRDGRGY